MNPSGAEKRFRWYDAYWLNQFRRAREFVARTHPERLSEFTRAIDPLRTRMDFSVQKVDRVFDDATLVKIKQTAAAVKIEDLEKHELRSFGRFIVHDHPWFTELQRSLTPLASALAGEPVEPCYNFLSLYSKFGVCPVHLDAPNAKWTLDICIEQTEPWPIHFSQTVPWPEEFAYEGDDWQEWIKRSPDLTFTPHVLMPGQALFFSGSSQWHYRDPLSPAGGHGSCKLLFFHFIPAGTLRLSKVTNWPELFGLPDLATVLTLPASIPRVPTGGK